MGIDNRGRMDEWCSNDAPADAAVPTVSVAVFEVVSWGPVQFVHFVAVAVPQAHWHQRGDDLLLLHMLMVDIRVRRLIA